MSKEISQFEARAYKRLYGLYKSTLLTIINMAKRTVEYSTQESDEYKKLLTFIGDEKQWDYAGIENKIDSKIIDELEKLLPDE
jgi:hypothetical protein